MITGMTLTEHYFPFHRFGLTRNPFGTLSDEERFQVTVPLPQVERLLADGFDHLLVTGYKGSGKTTTLTYLVEVLRREGETVAYERLPRFQMHYRTNLAWLDTFALDEMQRIAPWEAIRLFREGRGKRLLIGSHADHRLAFRLRGLDVTTIRLDRTASRERLARILARRLAVFQLNADSPADLSFSPDAIDWLWELFGSDLRAMNFFLYDAFQQIEEPGAITADWLRKIR
jgi:hypothetical protein